MLTSLGKFFRKLRIDNSELLADMASKLNVSPAFLSKVENGLKKPPQDWEDRVIELYALGDSAIKELSDCMFEALNMKSIDMGAIDDKNKDLMLSFARKINNLDDGAINKIKKILKD